MPQAITAQGLIAARNAGIPKFVGVGAVAPDTFYVDLHGGSVLVNPHEYVQPNVMPGFVIFDSTPYTFTNSPLIQLLDGGPSIGVALIR